MVTLRPLGHYGFRAHGNLEVKAALDAVLGGMRFTAAAAAAAVASAFVPVSLTTPP